MADDSEFPDDWLEEEAEDFIEATAELQAEAECDAEAEAEAEADAQLEAEAGAEDEAEASAGLEVDAEEAAIPADGLADEEVFTTEAEEAAASGNEELEVEELEAAALEALTAVEGEEPTEQEALDAEVDEDLLLPEASPGDEAEGDDADVDDLEALEAAALARFSEMPLETADDVVEKPTSAPKAPIAKRPAVPKPAVAKQPASSGAAPSLGKGLAPGKGLKPGLRPGLAKGNPAPWAAERRPVGKPGAAPQGKGMKARPAVARGPQGKGQQSGAAMSERRVGRRVVDLNKSGIWPQGQGIDVKALGALRQLPERRAQDILSDLEGLGSSVRNPSSYVQVAVRKAAQQSSAPGEKTAVAPWRSTADGKGGIKRTNPAVSSAGPPSKRLATDSAVKKASVPAAPAEEAAAAEVDAEEEKLLTKLPPAMLQKVKVLRKRLQLKAPALKALANHEQRDGLIVLQALGMREKVEDPTRFVVASLQKKDEMRQGKGGAGAKTVGKPVAKADGRGGLPPIDRGAPKPPQRPPGVQGSATSAGKPAVAKSNVAKPAVAKPSIGKTPGARPAAAKPAVAKAAKPGAPPAAAVTKPSGIGKPPRLRTGLDFEQMAVQGKLQSLNKLDIWSGPHPLDDAALTALLGIMPGRALEILDEAEEKGSELKNPSLYVQQAAKKDPR